MEDSVTVNLDTIPKRLKFIADTFPEREIFVCVSAERREAFTAGRLLRLAGKFAARLLQHGFQHGDVIANTLPNSPERIVTDIGIALAGCTIMNGQILLTDGSDFLQLAWQARCCGVILCPLDWSPAWRLLGPYLTDHASGTGGGIFNPMSHQQVSDLTTAVFAWPCKQSDNNVSGTPLLDDLESSGEIPPSLDLCQPDDVLCLLTTSGTSGISKLVPCTHGEAIAKAMPTYPGPKGTSTTAMATVVKQFNSRMLGCVAAFPFKNYVLGEVRVLVDTMPTHGCCEVAQVVAAIAGESCPTALMFPLQIEEVLDHVTRNEIKDFRLNAVITGGHPMKRSQVSRALQLAHTVVVGYACTEAGLVAFQAHQDASSYEDFYAGKSVPGMNIKVVDNNDQECTSGVLGSIIIKGSSVFSGYFNRQQTPNPTTVSAFTADGWYRTTDFGWISPQKDGTLDVYVIGRAKDVINRGGILLYPGWFEAKVTCHKDISEACILPVSDPLLNHKICLMVKAYPGTDMDDEKLAEYCHSIFVGGISYTDTPVPDYFKVLRGADFPETGTGKPNLHKLRKMAEDLFGAKEST